MLNEAARVCTEAGQFDTAEKLYRQALKPVEGARIAPARTALWNFRLEHALAASRPPRSEGPGCKACRRGQGPARNPNPEMAKAQSLLPCLAAMSPSIPATPVPPSTNSPGQSERSLHPLPPRPRQEQLGQQEKALEHFKQAFATTGHNPPAAYAKTVRPKKLAAK